MKVRITVRSSKNRWKFNGLIQGPKQQVWALVVNIKQHNIQEGTDTSSEDGVWIHNIYSVINSITIRSFIQCIHAPIHWMNHSFLKNYMHLRKFWEYQESEFYRYAIESNTSYFLRYIWQYDFNIWTNMCSISEYQAGY